MPTVCIGMHEVIPKIVIPTRFTMTINKIDELTGQTLFRANVVYNKHDLISFEKINEQRTITKIFELETLIGLELFGGECRHVNSGLLEREDHDLIAMFAWLFALKKRTFDYMGRRTVRNIMTDVYVLPNVTTVENGRNFVSIYVQSNDGGERTRKPIQFREETHQKNGDVWKTYQSYLYDIHDFKALETDDQQVRAFNNQIPKCDGQREIEFNLVAKSGKLIGAANYENHFLSSFDFEGIQAFDDFEDEDYEGQYEREFVYELRRLLSAVTGETVLNFLTIDVSIERTKIVSRIKYVDYIRSLESIEQKLNKIVQSSKENRLVVEVLDYRFNFNKIYSNKRESEIDRSQLYALKSEGQTISDKAALPAIRTKITNIDDCYSACTNSKNNFTCDLFALCRRPIGVFDCRLGSWMDRNSTTMNEAEFFSNDEECNLYRISALKHFQEHAGKQLIDAKNEIGKFDEMTGAECAQTCLNRNNKITNDERCLSIEVCAEDLNTEKTTCRLSGAHSLWDNEQVLKDNENCNVYSVKHLLNFYPTSQTVLKNFKRKKVDSLDQCSTVCDVSGDCNTFNYCDTER